MVDTAKSRTFSIAAARGGEGDPVAFTVTLARAGQPLAASVAYTVATLAGDTATAEADYTPAAATLAFDATATTAAFTVATREDTIAEGDETFTATLSAASAGTAVSATAGSARGTIADDDAAASDIALTLGPASVAEGAGATTVTVTATLAGDTTLATDTAVAVAVAGDTAAATDFAAVVPFTVTIDATQSEGAATFAFAPTDDAADEPAETVTVSGTAQGFTVAPAQLAIADDDPPTVVRVAGTDGEYIAGDVVPVAVTFSSAVDVSGAPRLLLETGTTDRHAAYAGGTGTATLRFDYTVQAEDGSGDLQYEGTDALALNGGRIQAAADSLDAALTLPALDAAGSLAGSGAVVVDTAKSRTFSIAAARGGEGDPVAFTVTLARAGQPLAASVAYTVATLAGDTATAEADYTPAAATLAFDATATTAAFTVATREDTIAEGDETFTATLSAASAGTAVSATAGSARGTIADDDAKPTVTIASGANHPTKDAFAVTITFSEDVTGFLASEVTVDKGAASASFTSQTAMVYEIQVTPDTDYDGAVTVSVAADTAADGNGIGNAAASETFAVDTKAPGFQSAAVAGNTLVLTYDEDLDAGSVPDASAYTVTAGPAADALTTAALAGADPVTVSAKTVTLTLAMAVAAGATVQVGYAVPGSGSKLQDALGNAAAALTAEAVTNRTAKPTVVIESAGSFPTKDAFAVTITFSEDVTGFLASEVTVDKGAAAASFTSQTAMVYEIQVTPDTDYDGAVTVSVAADTAADGNGIGNAAASETFAVDTKAPGFQSAAVAGNTLVLTYDEDLDAGSVPDASAYAVEAGPSGSLETAPLADADPVAVSGRTVTLKLAAAVAAGATVEVSYTVPQSGSKLQDALGNAAAALTNQAAQPTVAQEFTLTVSPTSVDEGATATTITVTALPVGTQTFASDSEVTVAVADGTATAGEDFAEVSAFVIMITAGDTLATNTFSLEPVDDAIDEPDETVTVSGTATGSAVAAAQIEIADNDDAPTLTLILSSNILIEGGDPVAVGAILSHPSSEDTRVEIGIAEPAVGVGTTGGSSTMSYNALKTDGQSPGRNGLRWKAGRTDLTTLSATEFTIPEGELERLDEVEIRATDDTVDSPTVQYTVSVKVHNGNGGVTGLGIPLVYVDNDGDPQATLVVWPVRISEQRGIATVSAVVQPPIEGETTTIRIAADAVSPAGAGAFRLSTARTLTVSPGVTDSVGLVTVEAIEDMVAGTDRHVSVSGTITGAASAPEPVDLTIVDSTESLPLLMGLAGDGYAAEGDEGTRMLVFRILLNEPADRRITVDYATSDDTAVAGQDYMAAQGTVTFETDDSSQTFSVVVRGDTDPESDERFKVTLSAATHGMLSREEAFGTIGDDDTVTINEDPPDGAIRLCSGTAASTCTDVSEALATRNTQGRVEVINDGVWGTVCDDYWSNDDGQGGLHADGLCGGGACVLELALRGRRERHPDVAGQPAVRRRRGGSVRLPAARRSRGGGARLQRRRSGRSVRSARSARGGRRGALPGGGVGGTSARRWTR